MENGLGPRMQPAPQCTAALEMSPASLEAPAEQIQCQDPCGGRSFFTPSPSSPVSSGLWWWCLLLIHIHSCLLQGTLLAAPGFCLADIHQHLMVLGWQQPLHQLKAEETHREQSAPTSSHTASQRAPSPPQETLAYPNLRMNLMKRFRSFIRKWRLMSSERFPTASSCQDRDLQDQSTPALGTQPPNLYLHGHLVHPAAISPCLPQVGPWGVLPAWQCWSFSGTSMPGFRRGASLLPSLPLRSRLFPWLPVRVQLEIPPAAQGSRSSGPLPSLRHPVHDLTIVWTCLARSLVSTSSSVTFRNPRAALTTSRVREASNRQMFCRSCSTTLNSR